jgi:membrane protein YqaA with SNARE-associated domain
MLRTLYDRTMALAASRHAVPALFGVSFVESSVFPIPPDALLAPMVLSKRIRWLWYVFVCTVGSVLGGLLGYAIGYFAFTEIAEPVLTFYGYGDKIDSFAAKFNEWGAWAVFIAGVTPFPYKVITVASGFTALSLPVFIVASILARGLRFFLVAYLLYHFGPPIRAFVERRLGLAFTVAVIVGLAGFLVLKVL